MEVRIVGPANRSTGGVSQYANEQSENLPGHIDVTIHDISPPEGTAGRITPRALFVTLVDALRFVTRRPPDVVHVHTSHYLSFYRASFYVLFATYLWRRPVILHVHGSSFDEFLSHESYAVGLLQSIVFSAAARVVVLSEYWRDVLSLRVDEDVLLTFPNAVDPEAYEPQYDPTPPHIVFVSNLLERKGTLELLEAIDRLSEREATFRVSIAGKGPLRDRVEDFADTHEYVEYLGYVNESEKRELLARGSIYVLPSHAEGLPIAILEGMAAGNAIVSTTVGSIPEVITEKHGVLVEPEASDQLADALADLIARPKTVEEMGRRNHELVRQSYSWPTIGERLANVYETCQS